MLAKRPLPNILLAIFLKSFHRKSIFSYFCVFLTSCIGWYLMLVGNGFPACKSMIFAGVCIVSIERSMKLRLYYNYTYSITHIRIPEKT
jgi:hypothetical protein